MYRNIVEFNQMITTYFKSLNVKLIFTENTCDDGIVDVGIAVLLKNLCKFRRILQMHLSNCEISLILVWLKYCIICEADRLKTFANLIKKLSYSYNIISSKLLQLLKSELNA